MPRISRMCLAVLTSSLFTQGSLRTALAESPKKDVTNTIGIKLTLIPAGTFMMGSNESPDKIAKVYERYKPVIRGKEKKFLTDRYKKVHLRHRVRISKPFYLGSHEVTVGQFRAFVAATRYKTVPEKRGYGSGVDPKSGRIHGRKTFSWRDPGYRQTDNYPVCNVSWNDAAAFCKWLSTKEGKTYRLPTEAEWEYACRAGTGTRYSNGNDPEHLPRIGNVRDASAKTNVGFQPRLAARDGYAFAAPVGSFRPNKFGLYDMHGNVAEWCADWYAEGYYAKSPGEDPAGPATGKYRIHSGGSWHSSPFNSRSAHRGYLRPGHAHFIYGFRVARDP